MSVRCHLASGKVVWLCAEHQQQDGVTVMSDEVANMGTAAQEAGIDLNSTFKDLMSSTNEGDTARRRAARNRPTSGSNRTRQAGLDLRS